MRAAHDIGAQSWPNITYVPRPDAPAEAEILSLAAVYQIVLNAQQKGRIPDKNGPNDGTEFKEISANEHRST